MKVLVYFSCIAILWLVLVLLIGSAVFLSLYHIDVGLLCIAIVMYVITFLIPGSLTLLQLIQDDNTKEAK